MEVIWSFICIAAVIGTYYGAWQHSWLIILLCAIPQILNAGYQFAKKSK